MTEIPYYKNIILASQSPRRIELLKGLGFQFKTTSLNIDENYPDHLKAGAITEYLSQLKAQDYGLVSENDLVITADTIVWFEDQALEKPKNEQDAIQMLLKLSDTKHDVYSSVGFKTSSTFQIITDRTEVFLAPISEEEAKYYVSNYNPMDKAGSYGIQDWLGLAKVITINGSFYNVMGFPTHLVYRQLMQMQENNA